MIIIICSIRNNIFFNLLYCFNSSTSKCHIMHLQVVQQIVSVRRACLRVRVTEERL